MSVNDEMQKLIGQMKSGNEDELISASVMLGQFGKEAVDHLISLLTDHRPLVREYTAMSLGITGRDGAAAVPSLLPLLRDSHDSVRYAVVVAISKIGVSTRSVREELQRLISDPDSMVAKGAADALKELRANVE